MPDKLPLVLGTAQLGAPYGIANQQGQPSLAQSCELIEAALKSGVRYFDTGQAYGDSERVIGSCLRQLDPTLLSDLKIITKLDPKIPLHKIDQIQASVTDSLNRLGVAQLFGFMFHRESCLDQKPLVSEIGSKLKGENRVTRIGVSVYAMNRALEAIECDAIDMIQLPFNLFDQRALQQDIFRRAANAGKMIFIRSIYLQGLLLMKTQHLPPEMSFARASLERLERCLSDSEISAKLMALGFVITNAPGGHIIFGAESASQVTENVRLFQDAQQRQLPDLRHIGVDDPQIIHPSNWPRRH